MSNPANIHSPSQYLAMEREFDTIWEAYLDESKDPVVQARVAPGLKRHEVAHCYCELPGVRDYAQFRGSDFGYKWNGQLEELLRGR